MRYINEIANKIMSNKTTQYFINGTPGSGKSHAMQQLKNLLPKLVMGSIVYEPVHLSLNNIQEYTQQVTQALDKATFLDEEPPQFNTIDEMWTWLSIHIYAPKKIFILLIDMIYHPDDDIQAIANFFSTLRALEGTDYKRDFQIHHIVTGYWNHSSLENHYKQSNISFPYTIGHNYTVWDGLSAGDIQNLISTDSRHHKLYALVLYEITGGYAQIVIELLQKIGHDFQLERLLEATQTLAKDSLATKKLISTWRVAPESAIKIVEKLLRYRSLLINHHISEYHYLLSAGLASVQSIGQNNYLCFKSWYSELVVRYNQPELNIPVHTRDKDVVTHLIPTIRSINTEAYQLIADIENSARNLIATFLLEVNTSANHFLEGFKKMNEPQISLTQVSNDNRAISKIRGLNTVINPDMVYISTHDLAKLIEEIGDFYSIESYKIIGKKMKTVKDIRNAVMHNQLIDENSLRKLYDLQSEIYLASSERL